MSACNTSSSQRAGKLTREPVAAASFEYLELNRPVSHFHPRFGRSASLA